MEGTLLLWPFLNTTLIWRTGLEYESTPSTIFIGYLLIFYRPWELWEPLKNQPPLFGTTTRGERRRRVGPPLVLPFTLLLYPTIYGISYYISNLNRHDYSMLYIPKCQLMPSMMIYTTILPCCPKRERGFTWKCHKFDRIVSETRESVRTSNLSITSQRYQ